MPRKEPVGNLLIRYTETREEETPGKQKHTHAGHAVGGAHKSGADCTRCLKETVQFITYLKSIIYLCSVPRNQRTYV